MTKNSTCTDSALLSQERLLNYKKFAVALSYPEGEFFAFFSDYKLKKEELVLEYDRLFRSSEIWLYALEFMVENEFQRAQGLADINGFYRAFGLETNKDRPDALSCELEFMYYLIFKEINAPDKEKALICFAAQGKFFSEHLYPAAKRIGELIMLKTRNNFYREVTRDLLAFLECEETLLKENR